MTGTVQALSDRALDRAECRAAESVGKHVGSNPYHSCRDCPRIFNRLYAIWDEIKARKDRR